MCRKYEFCNTLENQIFPVFDGASYSSESLDSVCFPWIVGISGETD